ncbi:MAG: hypothetical protein ACYCY1_00905 [Sulfuriferula sp.]
MNISALDKQTAQIGMLPTEAAHLLQGLEAMRDELGEIAEELINLLRGNGIEPPPKPEHVRTEYAGPE